VTALFRPLRCVLRSLSSGFCPPRFCWLEALLPARHAPKKNLLDGERFRDVNQEFCYYTHKLWKNPYIPRSSIFCSVSVQRVILALRPIPCQGRSFLQAWITTPHRGLMIRLTDRRGEAIYCRTPKRRCFLLAFSMGNVDFIGSSNSPLQHTRDAPYHRGPHPRPAFPISSPAFVCARTKAADI
jgi:hypothetical protein